MRLIKKTTELIGI